jgi:hypothetical protein
MLAIVGPAQGCRVTATLEDVDPGRMESLAAVVADHVVSVPAVSLPFREADIAGVECRPDYAVIAPEDKKLDGFALHLMGEVMRLAVIYLAERDTDQAVFYLHRFIFAAEKAEQGIAVSSEEEAAGQETHTKNSDDSGVHDLYSFANVCSYISPSIKPLEWLYYLL